jgi:class 3 adenylate cyclase
MATHDISLADLRQDIAGALPTDLALNWNAEAKTHERHAELLAPFEVNGTIVSTDSAGLSLLSQRYSLAQVMKLISEPKEVIHAFGRAIGGEAIGVWAADNSQMFYPHPIDPALVVEQMLGAQRQIRSLAVQVGMGIHAAKCYRLGGGLFGLEANFIEDIAEDDTAGGEIVVSDTVYPRLPEAIRAVAQIREDLREHGTLWSIKEYGGPLSPRDGNDVEYPTPFDAAFFQHLRRTSMASLETAEFAEYRSTHTVAFVKVAHPAHEFLLDTFTEMSLADLSCRKISDAHGGNMVKSTGALAIVLFDAPRRAVEFAREVILTNRRLGLTARVGVTRGEVFLFPLAHGGREIAGNPVNIASKLSEDSGLDGVLVEQSAGLRDLPADAEPFALNISRVDLLGHRIPV